MTKPTSTLVKRTHHCGELNSQSTGKTVHLIGWVESIRDHGGILFIDLRDRKGLTQILFDPQTDAGLADRASGLKPESVIGIEGEVRNRPEETVNRKLPTGEIEVVATSLIIHNTADTPPFPIEDAAGDKVHEDLRLSYRYLDLRRPKMREILEIRHKAAQAARGFFNENDFLEVETPSLFKSTPEGAREYLVPSRLNPGEFYALPQSPQQFKQMLMVAGVERYYQIVKCFRDEDLRADRQPEFTQIDVEMSFVDREDVYAAVEGMIARIWKETKGVEVKTPFPRLSYEEAMNRYGTDKPDTRFGIELDDLGALFKNTQFKVFQSVLDSGGSIKAFNAKGLADLTQGELNHLTEVATTMGAKGLAFIKAEKGEWKSPILKFFSEEEKNGIAERLKVEDGDIVFFAASEWEQACHILGRVRLEAAEMLKKRGKIVVPEDQYNFLWVVEFPLLLFDEEQGRYAAAHHPFTAPVPEDVPMLDTDPKKVRGQHYDLVLNGVELGGGSIRVHQPDLQLKLFRDIFDIPDAIVKDRFGYMVDAFRYGAPPHGGIAFGFDRLVAILAGTKSIRDVIAFPKTQKGQCLMTRSPGRVDPKQLRDLYIETIEPVE